jgi:hypothetical protein
MSEQINIFVGTRRRRTPPKKSSNTLLIVVLILLALFVISRANRPNYDARPHRVVYYR